MGRPPLALGVSGRIDFHHGASGRVRARARCRDWDGATRPVTRWGATRHEAETRLRAVLVDRTAFPAGDWSPMLTVDAAVSLWQADLDSTPLAPATRQLYAAAARLYVQPDLGRLRLGELSVAVIDRALASVLAARGPQRARAARRALSSLCAAAVRHGALGHNPVRDSRPIRCPRRRVRALTADEAADLQARLRADSTAVRLDLPDLVQFMLGTGVRIGEASAVRDAVLDHQAGTVHINATVVRVHGAGLQIQPRPKTLASERILALPGPVLEMLARRRATGRVSGPAGVVFASPAGMLRDPSNTQADLRAALDRIGYPWVTSHMFRKTVASRLDDAGFSIRHIADQLGHARPSTTLDHYLGRRAITTADFADALTDLASAAPLRARSGAVL
ncbi:MAG: tyrosine-type recombinase/integrase [Actinobacteria bacterium]|nr:tyrosine-type recombinase/integrase [Actinomycetota bacterium]